MNTNIFVINLLKDEERRRVTKALLDQYGLSYEFFSATNGRALSDKEKSLCANSDNTVLDLSGGRKVLIEDAMYPGEIGCALSHLRVYQEILDRDLDYAIIMEDDVALNDDTVFALNNIDCIKESWDIINFSSHIGIKDLPFGHKYYFNKQKKQYFKQIGMRSHTLNSIFNARRMLGLLSVYVVTADACKKLIDLGYPVRMPSDYLTGIIAYNKLKVFRAYPVTDFAQQRDVPTSSGHQNRASHNLVRL